MVNNIFLHKKKTFCKGFRIQKCFSSWKSNKFYSEFIVVNNNAYAYSFVQTSFCIVTIKLLSRQLCFKTNVSFFFFFQIHPYLETVGSRLFKPDCCPHWLFIVVQQCWLYNRLERPSMAAILDCLTHR